MRIKGPCHAYALLVLQIWVDKLRSNENLVNTWAAAVHKSFDELTHDDLSKETCPSRSEVYHFRLGHELNSLTAVLTRAPLGPLCVRDTRTRPRHSIRTGHAAALFVGGACPRSSLVRSTRTAIPRTQASGAASLRTLRAQGPQLLLCALLLRVVVERQVEAHPCGDTLRRVFLQVERGVLGAAERRLRRSTPAQWLHVFALHTPWSRCEAQ